MRVVSIISFFSIMLNISAFASSICEPVTKHKNDSFKSSCEVCVGRLRAGNAKEDAQQRATQQAQNQAIDACENATGGLCEFARTNVLNIRPGAKVCVSVESVTRPLR